MKKSKYIITALILAANMSFIISGCSNSKSTEDKSKTSSAETSSSTSFSSNENNKSDSANPEYTVVVSGIVAEQSVEELEQSSSAVLLGKIVDRANAFEITSVTGETSNFTDYYLEVYEAYRGNESEGDVVSIRLNEGIVGNLEVIDETAPSFEIGQEYLVFLYNPGVGGDFNTEGDYYYVNGATQGVYQYYGENELISEADANKEENNVDEFKLNIEDFKNDIEVINSEYPISEIDNRQEIIDNLTHNYENRFITEEQYNETIAQLDIYATITG